jgi:hypothetical protein
MDNNQPVWSAEVKCKYCETKFPIDTTTVIYGDLRPPDFFVADMQYYVVCPECNGNNIVQTLPSHVAVWIQNKMFTPK